MLPTLDDNGVAVHQTGGRDPLRGIRISGAPVGGPQPVGVAPSANPAMAPSPLDEEKGLQVVPPPQVAPGGRRRRGDAGCVELTGRSFRSPPKSVRRLQMGPRRPAPRPMTRRGASVPRFRHHHHHSGVITPRSTSGSNNNSSSRRGSSSDLSSSKHNSSRSGDHLASRVTRKSRAPSKCSPFFHEPNHHADKS
jgi:hypothetical protein